MFNLYLLRKYKRASPYRHPLGSEETYEKSAYQDNQNTNKDTGSY